VRHWSHAALSTCNTLRPNLQASKPVCWLLLTPSHPQPTHTPTPTPTLTLQRSCLLLFTPPSPKPHPTTPVPAGSGYTGSYIFSLTIFTIGCSCSCVAFTPCCIAIKVTPSDIPSKLACCNELVCCLLLSPPRPHPSGTLNGPTRVYTLNPNPTQPHPPQLTPPLKLLTPLAPPHPTVNPLTCRQWVHG
jgi:hypothetical protein